MRKAFILLLLILIIGACSDKFDDLVTRTGYQTLGNRNYDKYTDSTNGRMYGFTLAFDSYAGYGGGYFFVTNDNFSTFPQEVRGQIPDDYNITYLDGQSFSAWNANANGFVWSIDTLYGNDTYVYGSLSEDVTQTNYSGKYTKWAMSNVDLANGFIAANYIPETGSEFKGPMIDIYKTSSVNNQNGAIRFVNSLDSGYSLAAISVSRENIQKLWVMAYRMNANRDILYHLPVMFYSNDGGLNWAGPQTMSAGSLGFNSFSDITSSNLISYSKDYLLRSIDAGITWEKLSLDFIPQGGELLDIAYNSFESKTLYAVVRKEVDYYGSISDIYKSTDLGTSWSKLNQHDIYADRVDFYNNPDGGVAVSRNILQISKDGGRTWEVIMFPFED